MRALFPRSLVFWLRIVVWPVLTCGVYAETCANPIACENMPAGDNGWDISGSGDSSIQGFAIDISVNVGQTIFFKVNTSATSYRIDIYRIGYYGGSGARKVTTINPAVPLPQTQPPCLTDSNMKLVDCGNWAVSASWNIPPTAVSGIYLVRLIRPAPTTPPPIRA
jgi:N,N-dimethylformamidase beta subunit-like protein